MSVRFERLLGAAAHPRAAPDYLAGYPAHLREPVLALIEQQRFAALLLKRYPRAHEVRSDGALYDYVQALKADTMRSAAPARRGGQCAKHCGLPRRRTSPALTTIRR